MDKAAYELNEVKSIIRGLLISSAAVTSIRQLEIDFRNQEGQLIPVRSLGYPTTEVFLRSIPDTVHLREPLRGCPSSHIIVEPVKSEKSKHVEKMVTRQKNSKPLRGMKRSSAVAQQSSEKKPSSDSSRLNGMAPRFIPLALRTSLTRVCQRHSSDGLPLSALGSEISRDLSMAGWVAGGKDGWLSANGFGSLQEVIEGLIDQGLIRIVTENGKEWVISCFENEIDRHRTSLEVENRSFEEEENEEAHQSNSKVVRIPAGLEYVSNDEYFSDYDEFEALVSDRMKENFKDILAKHPDGLWCAALPYEYKVHAGCDLDVKKLGFVSVVDMASRLRDVFFCSRPDTNSDWLLFASQSNAVRNNTSVHRCKGNYTPTLPSKFVRKIESLLLDCPSGIERSKFLKAYKAKYNEDFPLVDFGFNSLMELLGHLAKHNIVHLKFTGFVPIICRPCSFPTKENVFGGFKKDDDFISALYPLNVVGHREVIHVQSLPEGFDSGSSFDVQVSEVKSPSSFWFQMWEANLTADFETMMDELQEFYNGSRRSKHKMPDAVVMIGQYCAVMFPPPPNPYGEWHRAIITALPSLSEAEVLYVDYGSTMKVRRSDIYFLGSRFAKLPLQAFKGRLTNIRPVGYGLWKKLRQRPMPEKFDNIKPVWSDKCQPFFINLIANKPSVATATGIRKSDGCLSLGLTDTSGYDDKHINDMFVEARLAEFGEMTDDEEDLVQPLPLQKVNEEQPVGVLSEDCSTKKNDSQASPLISPGVSSPLPPHRLVSTENGLPSPSTDRTSPLVFSYPTPMPPMSLSPRGKDVEMKKSTEVSLQAQKDVERWQQEEETGLNALLEKSRQEDVAKWEWWNRLEEQKLQEMRVMEEIKRLKIEERLKEQRRLEEKAKQEAQLQLELHKLHIQQQLLDLQQQQYQTQLLLLSAQNSLGAVMPPVMNPLLGSQVCLPAPPPGLINMMSFPNIPPTVPPAVRPAVPPVIPPTIPPFLARAMQPHTLPPAITDPLPDVSVSQRFPLGNQAYSKWNNFGREFGKPNMWGAGDNSTRKTSSYTPPGFENLSRTGNLFTQVSNVGNIPPFNPHLVCSTNGSSGKNLDVKPEFQKISTSATENDFNKEPAGLFNGSNSRDYNGNQSLIAESSASPVSTLNSNVTSSPNVEGLAIMENSLNSDIKSSLKDECLTKPVTTSSADVISPANHENPANPVYLQNGDSSYSPKFKSPAEPMNFVYPPSKVVISENTGVIDRKNNSQKSELLSELDSLLDSCNITSSEGGHSSAVAQDTGSQNHGQLEEEYGASDSQGKWNLKIHELCSSNESEEMMKGSIKEKEVNIIRVDGTNCVLTEEVLALFFNNLPVHVALKIAKMRPNGDKIKSVTLNPWKDRTLCKKIASLNVIEINPRGSDVHLITVDTLHFLCTALREKP